MSSTSFRFDTYLDAIIFCFVYKILLCLSFLSMNLLGMFRKFNLNVVFNLRLDLNFPKYFYMPIVLFFYSFFLRNYNTEFESFLPLKDFIVISLSLDKYYIWYLFGFIPPFSSRTHIEMKRDKFNITILLLGIFNIYVSWLWD